MPNDSISQSARRAGEAATPTPNPAIAMLPDGRPMPHGAPGGEQQAQAVISAGADPRRPCYAVGV